MRGNTKAYIAQEGGKLLSDLARAVLSRPHRPPPVETCQEQVSPIVSPPRPEYTPIFKPTLPQHSARTQDDELGYRWESCMKHLGGANVLLREAYERAIDEGIGEGTAEKIMEAMNEHAGMEADLEKMLSIPEAIEQAEKLMSGVRAFRKAAWEAKLPSGGGTKEDVADARLWNDLLYTEALQSAKAQPGQECLTEGM